MLAERFFLPLYFMNKHDLNLVASFLPWWAVFIAQANPLTKPLITSSLTIAMRMRPLQPCALHEARLSQSHQDKAALGLWQCRS